MVLVLVVVVLVSGVPTFGAASPPPSTPSASPAQAPVPPSPAPIATAWPKALPNDLSSCLLGIAPGCGPSAGSPTQPSSTAVSGSLSSWTNLTGRDGAASPAQRFSPAMTYYPNGHDVVMFGGYGEVGIALPTFFQDTWTFSAGQWTETIANVSCTPSTCPAARAGAMLAYYAPDQALLLFGGYSLSTNESLISYADTWLYTASGWQNITTTAGAPPSPRYSGSMAWDPADTQVVLFGGANATGYALGDTWTFDGTWHNVTGTELFAPYLRWGAAFAASPSGELHLFGGANQFGVITDMNCGTSQVAWWFDLDVWTPVKLTPCITVYGPGAGNPPQPNEFYPPCGRVYPALGWSPKNNRFVLYGGLGPANETGCTGADVFLNDTWTYANAPGGDWGWYSATDSGDPPAREQMGYASDLSDGFFEIFGGYTGSGVGLNETWRFFELVHAGLTGPSDIDTSGAISFNVPFGVTGYGGSGNLSYHFLPPKGLKNGNTIAGCANLTDGLSAAVPADGLANVLCTPTPTSYNVYRLTAEVVDIENGSDVGFANWTFTISPPEFMQVYSQYLGYFYTGLNFNDNLGIRAEVAGQAAVALNASIGSVPVSFTQTPSAPFWWTASVNVNSLTGGILILSATAQFQGDWELNASFNLNVVLTPNWLQSIVAYPQVQEKTMTSGPGPYNESYSVTYSFQWELDQALGFNLTIPLAGGNYSLVPSIQVVLVATSAGNITLTGQLGLKPPTISIGPASMNLTIQFQLSGNFKLDTENGSVTGLTWVSAVATFQLSAMISVGIPIYGFSVLGVNVGFFLNVTVIPAIALSLILVPTTPGNDEFISGIQATISNFVASFYLSLAVAVGFGIGIASIEIGGEISLALSLSALPSLYVAGGWVNGTLFVAATFLWYSTNYTIASGTIASFHNAPPTSRPIDLASIGASGYNNGSGAVWGPAARYYAGPGYDNLVWNTADSTGTAVSDIYPSTEVTAAAGAGSTYLLYTNDNQSDPVSQGLGVSGLALNSSTNALAGLPPPSDPGFVIASPQATRLPDGDIFAAWEAVPFSETSVASPLALTAIGLHGATYDPATGTWGRVVEYTSGGFIQSFAVDASAATPTLAALVAVSPLVGDATAERLVSFAIDNGAVLTNTSVGGLSALTGVRAAAGDVIGETLGGNYSLVSLSAGSSMPIAFAAPASSELVSATYAAGSADTFALLYRTPYASDLILYDGTQDQVLGSLTLGGNTYEGEAFEEGTSYAVFVSTGGAIDGWTESGGAFTNLTSIRDPGVASYGVVQFGSGWLVYSLTKTGPRMTPTVALELAEVGGQLAPITSPPTSPPSQGGSGGSSMWYWVVLVLAAVGVALLLAVEAIFRRRRPPGPAAPSPPPSAIPSPPPTVGTDSEGGVR
jgi:hypothetical protein